MVIVEVLEAIQQRVEGLHGVGQLVDGVELVAPGAVAALHHAVELGAPWAAVRAATLSVSPSVTCATPVICSAAMRTSTSAS